MVMKGLTTMAHLQGPGHTGSHMTHECRIWMAIAFSIHFNKEKYGTCIWCITFSFLSFFFFYSFSTEKCFGKCYSAHTNSHNINQSIHKDDGDTIIYTYVHGESSCQFISLVVVLNRVYILHHYIILLFCPPKKSFLGPNKTPVQLPKCS